MTAAASEIPEMELKFGSWDKTKCTEEKMAIHTEV
jgi:hypothetical protein